MYHYQGKNLSQGGEFLCLKKKNPCRIFQFTSLCLRLSRKGVDLMDDPVVQRIAQNHGKTPAQVLKGLSCAGSTLTFF